MRSAAQMVEAVAALGLLGALGCLVVAWAILVEAKRRL